MTVFNPGPEHRKKSIFQLAKVFAQACSARKKEAKELTQPQYKGYENKTQNKWQERQKGPEPQEGLSVSDSRPYAKTHHPGQHSLPGHLGTGRKKPMSGTQVDCGEANVCCCDNILHFLKFCITESTEIL